jgi:hypothetical protein
MKRLKLRAVVQHRVLGNAKDQGSGPGEIPIPVVVEIEQDEGGYYLFYLNGAAEYLSHTWHETLEEAKAQAHLELAIAGADWAPVVR